MVKKHSLKIKVSLKRTLGIGFTALLGTSPLGFSSGTYAMENDPSSDPKYLLSSQSSQASEEPIRNNEIESELDLFVDFSPESPFCKFLESKGINVSKLSWKKKKELFKRTVEEIFESYCEEDQRWPKFLGKIKKNPTKSLMNVVCEKRDYEVLDFIEKNYDEIKKKLPPDWLGLVKELYNLNNEQVAAIRECITKKRIDGQRILVLKSIYGTTIDLGDLLGDRNMVFQYFMLCKSKDGGSLSLEETKNKMDDKEFFNSCIKRILDTYSVIFTHDAVNITEDMRKEGLLK